MIFADEPTGALDQATGGEVMSLLTSACASTGASLVLVTHDPAVAGRLPHTIHVRDGRVFLTGPGAGPQKPAPASPERIPGAPVGGGAVRQGVLS